MGTQGFYRGTTHDQVPFFANKEKKMMEEKQWPPEYDLKLDFSKVNLEAIFSWISKRITELLGFEDDIVIDYCKQQLTPQVSLESDVVESVCPKKLQINLTGFLSKNAARFVRELWNLLLNAQESPNGIPEKLLEFKQIELEHKQQQAKHIMDTLSVVAKRATHELALPDQKKRSRTESDQSSSVSLSSSHSPASIYSKSKKHSHDFHSRSKKQSASASRSLDSRNHRKSGNHTYLRQSAGSPRRSLTRYNNGTSRRSRSHHRSNSYCHRFYPVRKQRSSSKRRYSKPMRSRPVDRYYHNSPRYLPVYDPKHSRGYANAPMHYCRQSSYEYHSNVGPSRFHDNHRAREYEKMAKPQYSRSPSGNALSPPSHLSSRSQKAMIDSLSPSKKSRIAASKPFSPRRSRKERTSSSLHRKTSSSFLRFSEESLSSDAHVSYERESKRTIKPSFSVSSSSIRNISHKKNETEKDEKVHRSPVSSRMSTDHWLDGSKHLDASSNSFTSEYSTTSNGIISSQKENCSKNLVASHDQENKDHHDKTVTSGYSKNAEKDYKAPHKIDNACNSSEYKQPHQPESSSMSSLSKTARRNVSPLSTHRHTDINKKTRFSDHLVCDESSGNDHVTKEGHLHEKQDDYHKSSKYNRSIFRNQSTNNTKSLDSNIRTFALTEERNAESPEQSGQMGKDESTRFMSPHPSLTTQEAENRSFRLKENKKSNQEDAAVLHKLSNFGSSKANRSQFKDELTYSASSVDSTAADKKSSSTRSTSQAEDSKAQLTLSYVDRYAGRCYMDQVNNNGKFKGSSSFAENRFRQDSPSKETVRKNSALKKDYGISNYDKRHSREISSSQKHLLHSS